MAGPIKLDFSEKYDDTHAEKYLRKHKNGLSRRLSHWRDEQLARKALTLVGEPGLVLDLPCGAGRFWPLLAEKHNRVIIGADNSESMIKVAMARRSPLASRSLNSAATMAIFIACSWNSGTPRVLRSTLASSSGSAAEPGMEKR